MNLKRVFVILPLLLSTAIAQTGLFTVKDSVYPLGPYIIYPYQKLITAQTGIGGTMPDGTTWDGTTWKPLKLNYDSTLLIIMGDQIIFREQLPYDYDLNSLEVIGKMYSYPVVKDKNALYVNKKIDTRPYKYINDLIYQDAGGDYYFLDPGQGLQFEKITGFEKLDLPSLKHVSGHFFSDKNGLYLLFRRYDAQLKQEILSPEKMAPDENGQIVPQLFKRYFFYGDSVFSAVNEQLHLNAKKTKEIIFNETTATLTDGNNFYEWPNCYCHLGLNQTYFKWHNFFRSNIDFEIPVPYQIPLFRYADDNNLHFSISNQLKEEAAEKKGLLIKTKAGYQLLHFDRDSIIIEKIKKVFIYNVGTKKEESFKPAAFKYINGSFFIYKDHLYCNNMPVSDDIDAKKIKKLIIDGFETNYLTDEKCLIKINNPPYYGRTVNISGVDFISLQKSIIRGVSFKYLKAISPDLLVDDKNIYDNGHIVPLDIPGLKMRVYTVRESGYTDFGF